MAAPQIQRLHSVEFENLAVDPGADKALRAQAGKQLAMLALAFADYWREQQDRGAFGQLQYLVDHLRDCLCLQLLAVLGAFGHSSAGVQQPQVVIDFGDRADR